MRLPNPCILKEFGEYMGWQESLIRVKRYPGGGKMLQGAKVPDAHPCGLSTIPETYIVEKENS